MKSVFVLALVLVPLARGSASATPQLVAFLNGTGVVVSAPDGSGAVTLPESSALADPAWSPDGSRLAYVSPPSMGPEIVVANADGTNVDPVTSNVPVDLAGPFSPAWSPDGSEVAFLRRNAGADESADVWLVTVATGALRQLTFDGGAKRGLRWQPHGSLILFSAASSDGGWQLWTVDAVTGARRIVGDSPGLYLCAAWSPDGSRIAFCDEHQQLSIVNADGTGLRRLASNLQGAPPAWSPDGAEVATAATRIVPGPSSRFGPPMNTDVVVVDVASGQARRLTGWSDPDVLHPFSEDPGWWPDGSRLYYLGPGATRSEMNADGSCQHQAPGILGTSTSEVSWRPVQPLDVGPLQCVDLRLRVTTDHFGLALSEQGGSTITIENDGNQLATGVGIDINAVAPAVGYFFCPDGTSAGECSLPDIAPGENRTIQAVVGRPTAGNIDDTVTIRSDEPSLVPADATTAVFGEVLNCTIVGTPAADDLTGTRGDDRICGGTGADRIDGKAGNDYLDGGPGDDTIIGGAGDDTIIGRAGNDVIYARDGRRDWIDCGPGHDIAIVDPIDHTRNCEKVIRR